MVRLGFGVGVFLLTVCMVEGVCLMICMLNCVHCYMVNGVYGWFMGYVLKLSMVYMLIWLMVNILICLSLPRMSEGYVTKFANHIRPQTLLRQASSFLMKGLYSTVRRG